MNNCAKGVFIFSIGVVVGAVIAYKYMSNKDEYIEEIAIDGKQFAKVAASQNDDENEHELRAANEPADISEAYKTLEKEYVNYSDMYKTDDRKTTENREEIYPIDPNEYGEDVDYTFSFTLYSDGVLADELDDEILNPESRIGEGILSKFMKSDSDEIHIRNERTKSDYEIVKDERRYSDVVGD